MNTVLVLNNDRMGHGDPELGRQLLGTFLAKSGSLKGLDAIVFYNTGVKLVAKGSPILALLDHLHEDGIDLLPCGTCLNHFNLEPVVGEVSDMDSIIRQISDAKKVITL